MLFWQSRQTYTYIRESVAQLSHITYLAAISLLLHLLNMRSILEAALQVNTAVSTPHDVSHPYNSLTSLTLRGNDNISRGSK